MKDLVIYEKQTRLILGIITDYKKDTRLVLLHSSIDSYIVDSNSNYILADNETGLAKFINPDNNIIHLDDYR